MVRAKEKFNIKRFRYHVTTTFKIFTHMPQPLSPSSEIRYQASCFGMSQSRENLGRSCFWSRLEEKTEGLSLGPQRLILQAHFQQHKFTEVDVGNRPCLGLHSTACHSRSLCFSRIDLLNPCNFKQLLYLV